MSVRIPHDDAVRWQQQALDAHAVLMAFFDDLEDDAVDRAVAIDLATMVGGISQTCRELADCVRQQMLSDIFAVDGSDDQ